MNKARVWLGICIFGFGLWIFVYGLSYNYKTAFGPGPGFFPRWLSFVLMGLSAVLVVQTLASDDEITLSFFLPGGGQLKDVLCVLAGILVFIFGSMLFGYIAANTLMMLILTSGKMKWSWCIIVSLGLSILIYVLFHGIMLLQLPVGILGF